MKLKGKFANAIIHTSDVDQNTIDQVNNLINCDVSEGSTIHIMPDCHAGTGCTIGTTMTIKDRVCPNLVGCDVGCGILCLKVQGKFTVDDFLNACEKVPSGVGKYNSEMTPFDDIKNLSFPLERPEQALYSIGTLGSGNHFIELNEDEDGNYYTPSKKVKFHFEDIAENPTVASKEFPYIFNSGRGTVGQWHTQVRSREIEANKIYSKESYVLMNPELAKELNIAENERVKIASQNGVTNEFNVVYSDTVKKDHLYAPMHYIETNSLTPSVYDPYSKEPSYKTVAVNIIKK